MSSDIMQFHETSNLLHIGVDQLSALEIIDGHRLYRISEREVEDARVEVQLTFESTLNVLGTAESMLLTGESDVRNGQAFPLQCFDHHFSLIGQDNFVIKSLEEDHRARKTVGEMDWRAFVIEVTPLRIGTHKPLQVT